MDKIAIWFSDDRPDIKMEGSSVSRRLNLKSQTLMARGYSEPTTSNAKMKQVSKEKCGQCGIGLVSMTSTARYCMEAKLAQLHLDRIRKKEEPKLEGLTEEQKMLESRLAAEQKQKMLES